MESKFYIQAQEFIKKEAYSKALKLLNKAIAEQPNNPNYYSHRGVTYFHLDHKKESLADMNKSVELEPDYGYRYASRAYIKSTMGDLMGAIEDYTKATELDPEDSVSFNNLGLMQEKLGYEKKALENFEKADKLVDLLENTGVESEEKLKPRNIQKEIEKERKEQTTGKVLLDVFRKKETFREFIQFIKGGLKK